MSVLADHQSSPTLPQLDAAAGVPGPRITAPPLVDARWLLGRREDVCIIDVRGARERRSDGCIPGSVALPTQLLHVGSSAREALVEHGRRMQHALAELGIEPDAHVVLVDDGDGSASLAASLCTLAGLRRTSAVLGDAQRWWRALGGVLEEQSTLSMQPASVSAWHALPPRLETLASFEQLTSAVEHGSARVLDVRSQLEHEGIVGSACCTGQGAIPGSVHLEWTMLLDHAGLPQPRPVVEQLLTQVGIEPDEDLIVTCHAGQRAATAARILRGAGLRNVRLSIGSWHEWSLLRASRTATTLGHC